MTEEQRPPGEPDEDSPEQVAAPMNLEDTSPVSYPPPAGSPFVHQSPSPAERLFGPTSPVAPPSSWESTTPEHSGSPYPGSHDPGTQYPATQYPGTQYPDPGTQYPDPGTQYPGTQHAATERSASHNPLTQDPSGRRGSKGLGAGAIVAMVAGGLAIALVAAILGGMAGALLVRRSDGGAVSLPPAPVGSIPRPNGSIADIAARTLPSVVTIKVSGPGIAGTGSGFVLRADGYILTNNHVVEAATDSGKISVTFSDGKKSDATVIGRDASYDLAVIRVDRRGLPVLLLGASAKVVVGDQVIAVGAPLGLDSTVTSGIVSALNRPVTAGEAGASSSSFINAIQTDAAINPGNSGGPLLDMAGRVIGVNSAIARVASSQGGSDTQSGSIGVGFAIPSDQIRKTAEQLISRGKATHPVIGVGLDPSYEGEGVKIASVSQNGVPPISKGGPADKAGLRAGEVILKFDGRTVTGPDEFVVAIRAKSVGDVVVLTVRNGVKVRNVKMTLQAAS
jgi:putative serine protease PepD